MMYRLSGVPDNLYIIGTQNTTDRSTGSIDYAVRRRFAFVTLPSSVEVLQAWYEDKKLPDELKASAVSLFKEINGNGDEDRDSFIAKHKTGDFDLEDLKVGHSYFMAYDFDSLRLKMEFEVVPLLREYIKDGILADHQGDTELFSRWIECTPKISVQDD
ncbi:MAG: restriction endonuclease, partial [Muribaculaceae bacterium]|nr:restriction endonuclease [Muribaculaceae bacterium]